MPSNTKNPTSDKAPNKAQNRRRRRNGRGGQNRHQQQYNSVTQNRNMYIFKAGSHNIFYVSNANMADVMRAAAAASPASTAIVVENDEPVAPIAPDGSDDASATSAAPGESAADDATNQDVEMNDATVSKQ